MSKLRKLDNVIKEHIDIILTNLGGLSFEGLTILVTGGAGFLGSWVCQILVEQRARVICLDDLSSGLRFNISNLFNRGSFKFIEHDISQPIQVRENVDLVMHMASRASPFEFEAFPIEILKANTLGTLVALEIARNNKAKFIYASSSEIYGDPHLIPTPESYWGNVSSVGLRGCYDESKRCGEAYVMAYRKQYNLDVKIARIFNTYGPRMRADGIYGRVIPRFVKQALSGEPITIFGTGEQTRSFCYITDQVEGLLRLGYLPQGKGEVINIGNEEEVKIMELAEMVRGLTNSSTQLTFHPLPQDDPKRRCPNITKAKEILNWKPRVGLEDGLSKMIDWFRLQS